MPRRTAKSPPGVADASETSSEIVRATTVPAVALAPVTVGAILSVTVTVAPSSWLAPSVIPPEAGLVYVSVKSGFVSGRSPESVRVIVSELPPGSVLAETVRAPASAPPSDQWEPSAASASTFPSNVTVMEFNDVATALSMAGGVMSAEVSTLTDEKSARSLPDVSATFPEVLS